MGRHVSILVLMDVVREGVRKRIAEDILRLVSILVLMDVVREASFPNKCPPMLEYVSILVLMDVVREDQQHGRPAHDVEVSILVLMDVVREEKLIRLIQTMELQFQSLF